MAALRRSSHLLLLGLHDLLPLGGRHVVLGQLFAQLLHPRRHVGGQRVELLLDLPVLPIDLRQLGVEAVQFAAGQNRVRVGQEDGGVLDRQSHLAQRLADIDRRRRKCGSALCPKRSTAAERVAGRR